MRFVYLDYPFLGQESFDAAEAAHCAQDQDRFWEYHDLLFESQSGENVGDFKRENLDKLARQLNLDMAAFGQCLDTHKYRDFIRAELAEGQQAGVRSTPTIFVNQQAIPGFIAFDTERVERSLPVAPGATLTGQELLTTGATVCLTGQVDDRRRITSGTVTLPPGTEETSCGVVRGFTAATATTVGELTIEQEAVGLKQIIEDELKAPRATPGSE